ncbi:MAG: OsmC family protein [Leptospirales bacterium]|nr:OsmC family protein [Leptospirales bacterium]
MSEVKVHRGGGKVNQTVEVGVHRLVADEPVTNGGEDTGPAPHDFLAIALGTCTAITLRMYSQHKQWPLEDAEVTVTVSKESDSTRLNRTIRFVGDLDDAQKARLLAVANQCPVHKTLSGKIEIVTNAL